MGSNKGDFAGRIVRVEYEALSAPNYPKSSKSASPGNLFLLAMVMTVSIFDASCTSSKSPDTEPTPVLSGPPSSTYPVPPIHARADMGWTLRDGKRANMEDYAGKVLVLDFYATWCVPCRESIPRLIALQNMLGSKGLEIVGLNVGGPDDRIKAGDFAKELGIQYSLGFPDKSLTDLFLSDDRTIPQTFLFDRHGELAKRFIGYDESTATELAKAIEIEIKKQ